ncbi:MAG: radical SAM protein [Myxococcota bacterium]
MASSPHRERIDAFLDHSRSFEGLRYVYPVVSRRSGGLSIGVNLNPDKRCNFDCVYCQVDRTIPAQVMHVDLEILAEELRALMSRVQDGRIWLHPRLAQTPAHLRRLNDIAFSGDGEPTTEKRFPEAVQLAVDLLKECELEEVTPVLITDAACLHHDRVRRGLDVMHASRGIIWAKLDAGTAPFYEVVNRSHVPFRRVLANLALAVSSYRVVVQSLFFRAEDTPPSAEELQAYCERLVEIEAEGPIEEVHIYTIARRPAEPWCTPLRDAEVDALVAQVSHHVRAPVRGFYGPPEL